MTHQDHGTRNTDRSLRSLTDQNLQAAAALGILVGDP
jgi:hypothetical protein